MERTSKWQLPLSQNAVTGDPYEPLGASVTDDAGHKRPFKGKGAVSSGALAEIEDWRTLPRPFRSLTDARRHLADIEARRDRLKGLAQAMLDSFKAAYPSARLSLCRSPDRSHTLLRWRHTARHLNMARSELDRPAASAILAELPEAVRRDWIRYEEYRVHLNLYVSLTVYEIDRTRMHIEALTRLRQLRSRYPKTAPEKRRG